MNSNIPDGAESKVRLRSGSEIPVLGLGTWQLKRETAATVARAFDLGYSMVDTSGDYGTQRGVGKALQNHADERASLFVVTKVEETDDAYEAVPTSAMRIKYRTAAEGQPRHALERESGRLRLRAE